MNSKDGYVGWKRLDGLRDDGREVLKRQRKHHFYHPKNPIPFPTFANFLPKR